MRKPPYAEIAGLKMSKFGYWAFMLICLTSLVSSIVALTINLGC